MPEAPIGKRAANRERTRTDLAAAAMELFDERGFDDTTVDEIAAAAGVSRRTLFRHFPTKSDIVFADHPDRIVRLDRFLHTAPPERLLLDIVLDSAVATIPSFVDPADFYLRRHRLLKRTPELRYREQAYGLQYTRVLARFLRPRLARLDLDDDPNILSDALSASIVTVVNRAQRVWAATNGDTDAEAVTIDGVQILRRAFGPLIHPADSGAGAATVIVMNADGTTSPDVVRRLQSILDTG